MMMKMTTKMTDDHDDDDDIVCVCASKRVCVVLQHWSPSALVPIGSGPTIGGPHHLLEIPSSAVGLFITSDPHHQQRSHHQQWSNHPIFLHANTHTDTHTHAHTLLLSSSWSSVVVVVVVVVVIIIILIILLIRILLMMGVGGPQGWWSWWSKVNVPHDHLQHRCGDPSVNHIIIIIICRSSR